MKGKNVLRAFWVMALLALVFAVPASAGKPQEVYREVFEEDGTTPACGLDIPYHVEGKSIEKDYYDKKNETSERSAHFLVSYTVSNNGHEVTFHSALKAHFTYISDEQTLIEWSGSDPIATIPGHGLVRATTGRIVALETCHPEGEEWVCEYEIYHWSGLDFVDSETICNYLLTGE